jgi:hypothetical protein
MTLEEAMVEVWRRVLVEGAGEVELEGQKFPVRVTPRRGLREADFVFEGQAPRKTALETRKQKLEMGKPQERARRRSLNDTSGKIVLRGLEQNPKTESRWAQLAHAGHKVMQFLSGGRYIGVVVDGKVTMYGGKAK